MRTDVPDPETRVENEPMGHVENDPKVNDNSVDENPANEPCESTTHSETIDENNVILPHRSTRARKPVDRYGAVPYMRAISLISSVDATQIMLICCYCLILGCFCLWGRMMCYHVEARSFAFSYYR